MSQSRELQLHITQMEEIRVILNSMKNLALLEIHKLARFQNMQGQVVTNIENAAIDFLAFYPCLPPAENNAKHICILMGAERGFCGDFNESLINAIAPETYSGIIAIGSRLYNKLAGNLSNLMFSIEGANVAEEVPAILNRLIDNINSLETTDSLLILTIVYHDNAASRITQKQVLPPFPEQNKERPNYKHPPLLNLDPADFFSDLVDHYLFAVLHEIFYNSLISENHRRLQHLEGAVKHLDDETVTLRRKSQVYRQEEITEEIEVILLNAENF
ncbi:MAG: F0F1 ATP synthase subunit gamma [Methylobacter sp.]|nr:F0F1 ATP synthase subunit gamma [Methylobacter sp.]